MSNQPRTRPQIYEKEVKLEDTGSVQKELSEATEDIIKEKLLAQNNVPIEDHIRMTSSTIPEDFKSEIRGSTEPTKVPSSFPKAGGKQNDFNN